ncbi:MAG: porin [Betaproteobacteria bacterium]
MRGKLISAALLAIALSAGGARADDAGIPGFALSGFGTVGAVHSSLDTADFTGNSLKPNGAGFTHQWSADVDSLLAVQATANLTPRLSVVLQVISEQNPDKTYRPHAEWANIKYQFTPDFHVRVGRIGLPIFMISDSRKIGYSNPWVRPPLEVYNLVPVTNSDGIDASYRIPIGAATNTFQATAGRSDIKYPDTNGGDRIVTAKARDFVTLADTFEHGFITLRLNYGLGHVTINELDPLFDAFRQFGPQGEAIADKYNVNARLIDFIGMGASYDPGNWFVMGEWGRLKANSAIGDSSGWYASAGYRFGKFTPYLTYGRTRRDSNSSDPGLDASMLPPYLAGPAMSLNGALNSALANKVDQSTISAGGRWDLFRNVAFKLQYDYIRVGADSTGMLRNTQPGFQLGSKLHVLSATVDFVF